MMGMSNISNEKAAARESARQKTGQFGEQHKSDPGQLDLGAPTPVEADYQATSDKLEKMLDKQSSRDHHDTLREAKLAKDRDRILQQLGQVRHRQNVSGRARLELRSLQSVAHALRTPNAATFTFEDNGSNQAVVALDRESRFLSRSYISGHIDWGGSTGATVTYDQAQNFLNTRIEAVKAETDSMYNLDGEEKTED